MAKGDVAGSSQLQKKRRAGSDGARSEWPVLDLTLALFAKKYSMSVSSACGIDRGEGSL